MGIFSSITQPFKDAFSNPMNVVTGAAFPIAQLGAAKNMIGGMSTGGKAENAGAGGINYGSQPQAPNLSVLGQQGREQLGQRATAQGPSLMNQLLEKRQAQDETTQLGNVRAAGQGALAQTKASLARSGGLTGGASTALEGLAMRDMMKQGQQVRAAGAGARNDLAIQDETQKTGLLQTLVGSDIAQEQNAYNQQMAAWAAQQQGNAIAKANQPGLFGKITGGITNGLF